jgi:hypothetical protein
MNGLYGCYTNESKLSLSRNLESLMIDDNSPLSDQEKGATIGDLMSARSGIFLPSAYSPKGMEKNLPARGSHDPGTFWYYNNWDFNVLSTIFENETGEGVFKEFGKKIANPIQMEDYREMDGFYRYENEKSKHPAYLFKMSARDLARYGLLYLQNGEWETNQIIPEDWIRKSTSTISDDLGRFSEKGSYGMLWWISELANQKMYYASGSGGQRLMVFPQSEIVVVHLVNTYEGKNVSSSEINELVEILLGAQTNEAIRYPSLISFNQSVINSDKIELTSEQVSKFLGTYKHPFLGNMTVQKGESGLELKNSVGLFRLFALGENQLFPEDIEEVMEFIPSPDPSKDHTIQPVYGENRALEKVIFYF